MERLARGVAGQLDGGCNVIALTGNMGTGKTTFVKALARALEIEELVVSPTFVLMNEYLYGRLPVYHVDLYRMGDRADFSGLSSEDGLDSLDFLVSELDEIAEKDCLIAIEWAELLDRSKRGQEFLAGHEHLAIDLQYVTNSDLNRLALMDSLGMKYHQLLRNISEAFGDMMEDS